MLGLCNLSVLRKAQGKGIGSKLCLALEKVLFYQGYRRIYALITAENEKSVTFHQKLGYTLRAQLPDAGFKFGRWIGVVWMDKPLDFVDSPSCAPTPVGCIVDFNQKLDDILAKLSLS